MSEFNVIDASGNAQLIGSFWVPTVVNGTFAPAAAYAEGVCVGGLAAINLGSPAKVFSLQLVSLALLGLTAGIGVDALVFEQNPTGSTFTDGVAASLVSADLAKLAWRGSIPAQPNYYANMANTFDGFPRRMITTDSGSKIYVGFISQGGIALGATRSAELRIEARS